MKRRLRLTSEHVFVCGSCARQQVCEVHLYGTNRLEAAGHSSQSDKIGANFKRSTWQETLTWERLEEALTEVL